ncbi:hypothetical protein CVT25_000194 [Psilocybe cyanescens]|uniref:Protein yippee-like n=1 Tax=Psilocybe cyanescens TaxID=93625 RepID=A0A409XQA0_PSICY|nr:hypothetical protein CVT25_000194 [Psilocybe cyanescens]
MLLSPTSDTRNLVVQAYEGHPTYLCSKCSAVIVCVYSPFAGKSRSNINVSCSQRRMSSLDVEKIDLFCGTGVHTVADVFCLGCNDRLGWFYHKAADHSQKYKEGKYLLEREKLVKENAWVLDDGEPASGPSHEAAEASR